ncbi:hypothetical protein CSA17_00170 [bacterium DOLJORAL78_65_58]|nr:MAG: hypothetical protein CSB20_10605 [bacterium DOLZORAL124_64_63]PIE76829.1 MAG: hypothetical protein CSA17_00170 [bacterium DOLJORAL78_65_58]
MAALAGIFSNTSFKVPGEPIVRGPEDAYHCFRCTRMNDLVPGDFVPTRRPSPPGKTVTRNGQKNSRWKSLDHS